MPILNEGETIQYTGAALEFFRGLLLREGSDGPDSNAPRVLEWPSFLHRKWERLTGSEKEELRAELMLIERKTYLGLGIETALNVFRETVSEFVRKVDELYPVIPNLPSKERQ